MSDYAMEWNCDTVTSWLGCPWGMWENVENVPQTPPATQFKFRDSCCGPCEVFTLDYYALVALLGEDTIANEPNGVYLVHDCKGAEWRIKGGVITDYVTWCSNFVAWEWGIGFVVVQGGQLYATNRYVYDRFVEQIGPVGVFDVQDI